MTHAPAFRVHSTALERVKIGRFISEDPIGLNGGIDLYAYVAVDMY